MEVMRPSRHRKATLVDLLDRILEKGVVINADIVITLAGIPMIGISLRAAVAGMETMIEYGMMQEWDARIRGLAAQGDSCKDEGNELPPTEQKPCLPLTTA